MRQVSMRSSVKKYKKLLKMLMPRTPVKQGRSRFPKCGDDKFDDAHPVCDLRASRLCKTNVLSPRLACWMVSR